MNSRAVELAKWIRVRAQVISLEKDALAGAAAGVVAPALPAAVANVKLSTNVPNFERRLVLIPITDHSTPARPRPLMPFRRWPKGGTLLRRAIP